MPPQFRSNRSVAPKLMLIITANVQIHLNLPIRRCVESPFCPRAKVINISIFFSTCTSSVAPLLPFLFKNTLALPPPLQLPRVSRIQVQELPLRQWLPSPRSQRYVSFLHLHLCPPILFPIPSVAFLISAFIFQNLRGNAIIPLENQSGMVCLGPMGDPDPTSIINLETSRIPLKSSNMNLDWTPTFRSWPNVTPGWRNWFRRIASS